MEAEAEKGREEIRGDFAAARASGAERVAKFAAKEEIKCMNREEDKKS